MGTGTRNAVVLCLAVLVAVGLAAQALGSDPEPQAIGNCPDTPHIQFFFTVGLGPGCGSDTSLQVSPGTEVTFCWRAVNGDDPEGSLPMEWWGYNITDSHFGEIVDVPPQDFVNVLPASQSVQFTRTLTVNQARSFSSQLTVYTDRFSTVDPVGQCAYQENRSVAVSVTSPERTVVGSSNFAPWAVLWLVFTVTTIWVLRRRRSH